MGDFPTLVHFFVSGESRFTRERKGERSEALLSFPRIRSIPLIFLRRSICQEHGARLFTVAELMTGEIFSRSGKRRA